MARRLDESNWRPMHTRIAAALGIGWMLDAFEVQIIGSVIPGIQAEFNLDGRQAVLINIVWFAGIALGALGFGYLAEILLAEASVMFNLTTVFVVLGVFWLIGAAAGALWWLKGTEARGVSVDVLGVRTADISAGLSG